MSVFMDLVSERLASGQTVLAAWCVMNNHAHMLIKAEKEALSKAIKTVIGAERRGQA
jgi:REP element-mobilizing transposase RayT